MHRNFRLAKRLALPIVGLPLALITVSPVGANSTIDALEGKWSGSGRLVLDNGATERIRCRGTARSSTANSIDQRFNCASAGKNFSFKSSMHISGRRVRGEWEGSGRNGTLLGNATGSSIQARLSSPKGNGSFTTTFGACRQSVRISGSGSNVKSLSMQLRKEC